MKRIILFVLFACGLGVTQPSCPGPGPNPVTHAIIDCTLQNQDQIASLIAEFKVILTGQSPDWAIIYQRAKNAGKAIGGCALAQVVQDYLGNRGAPPTQQGSAIASDTLERFRKEEAGGAAFHTTAGDL